MSLMNVDHLIIHYPLSCLFSLSLSHFFPMGSLLISCLCVYMLPNNFNQGCFHEHDGRLLTGTWNLTTYSIEESGIHPPGTINMLSPFLMMKCQQEQSCTHLWQVTTTAPILESSQLPVILVLEHPSSLFWYLKATCGLHRHINRDIYMYFKVSMEKVDTDYSIHISISIQKAVWSRIYLTKQ